MLYMDTKVRAALEALLEATGTGLTLTAAEAWNTFCVRSGGKNISAEQAALAFDAWEMIKAATQTDDLQQILALVHREEKKDFSEALAAFRKLQESRQDLDGLLEGYNNWTKVLRATSDEATANDVAYDLDAWGEVVEAAGTHELAEIITAIEGWNRVTARTNDDNPNRICFLFDRADGWDLLCAELGHQDNREIDTVINKVLGYKKRAERSTLTPESQEKTEGAMLLSPEDRKALALGRAMLAAIPQADAPRIVSCPCGGNCP